jgi:hypothetical protein
MFVIEPRAVVTIEKMTVGPADTASFSLTTGSDFTSLSKIIVPFTARSHYPKWLDLQKFFRCENAGVK